MKRLSPTEKLVEIQLQQLAVLKELLEVFQVHFSAGPSGGDEKYVTLVSDNDCPSVRLMAGRRSAIGNNTVGSGGTDGVCSKCLCFETDEYRSNCCLSVDDIEMATDDSKVGLNRQTNKISGMITTNLTRFDNGNTRMLSMSTHGPTVDEDPSYANLGKKRKRRKSKRGQCNNQSTIKLGVDSSMAKVTAVLISALVFVSIVFGQQGGNRRAALSSRVQGYADERGNIEVFMGQDEVQSETTFYAKNIFSRSLQPDERMFPTFKPTYITSDMATIYQSKSSCMNLTVAMFFPPSPFGNAPDFVAWGITSIEEDKEVWGMEYGISRSMVVIEHANGTNSNAEDVCLPEGTYQIFFENYRQNQDDDTLFALFSENHKIKCGILSGNDDENIFQFQLPAGEDIAEDSGCNTDVDITEQFDAFQCYWSAIGTYYRQNFAVNRTKWFDEKCGPILANACFPNLLNPPFGFQSLSSFEGFSGFCEYHQCEYNPIKSQLSDEVRDCECLFVQWQCSKDIEGCNVDPLQSRHECCDQGGSGCECILQSQCRDGDEASCDKFEQHCCEDGDKGCDCEFVKEACIKSLESGSNSFCNKVEESCCGGYDSTMEEQECQCDFWEPICINKGLACEKAIGGCCRDAAGLTKKLRVTIVFNDPHCACDFYHYATESVGYEFKDKEFFRDIPCSQAEKEESTPSSEQESLKLLYSATRGNFWFNNTGWMTATNHCEWHGVYCIDGQVARIELRSNNLTGSFLETDTSAIYGRRSYILFSKLQSLDLADNRLTGNINHFEFFRFRDLENIDLSQNNFSGRAEALLSPSSLYVNFSHNSFTSVNTFKRFKRSHRSLQSIDLSHNKIQQQAGQILFNMPLNLEEMVLSHNFINGDLPNLLEGIDRLAIFKIDNNDLEGTVPDWHRPFPNLRVLNLENEKGLTGSIPAGIFNLVDLSTLVMSHNNLSGTIPPEIGKSTQLKTIRLASNNLKGTIPSELGKLASLEEVDVSNNELSGVIPSQLGNFQFSVVKLRGNFDMSDPAPLSLCFVSGFDLANDTYKCPIERNALKAFFHSTKGQEWTNSSLWVDEYIHHCTWFGVSCAGTASSVINLTLANNGLSGKLSDRIKDLASLRMIDLGGNDIKGSIPSALGSLSNLTYLRLSYNAFVGRVPSDFGNLNRLEVVQLHGNRITGTMPRLNVIFSDPFSFVADCGVPSDFDVTLECTECTMCCNSREDCYPNTKTWVQKGFDNYQNFTGVFFIGLISLCLLFSVSYFLFLRYRGMSPSRDTRRPTTIDREDKRFALAKLGENSVYLFFLSHSVVAWVIALTIMAVQIWVLYAFVRGAEYDLSDDNSDLVYTFRCPRDGDECKNDADLGVAGWIIFGILMVSHLLADIVNGLNLVMLCAKDRSSTVFTLHTRIRCFFGGILLTIVTSFTLFVSIIYNKAIATSNTEIIINAVVILFVTDLDEQFFELCKAVNPGWIQDLRKKQQEEFGANRHTSITAGCYDEETYRDIQNMKEEILSIRGTLGILARKCTSLNTSSDHSNDAQDNTMAVVPV